MNIKFINSGNTKISNSYRLLLNFSDKIDLKRSDKYFPLSNLSIYYIWKNVKKIIQKRKFKISTQTWNDEFDLPGGSYSASDIQDYFENIWKKHEEKTDSSSTKKA